MSVVKINAITVPREDFGEFVPRFRTPAGEMPRGQRAKSRIARYRTDQSHRYVTPAHPTGRQHDPDSARQCRRQVIVMPARTPQSGATAVRADTPELPPVAETGLGAADVLCADDIVLSRPGRRVRGVSRRHPPLIPGNHLKMATGQPLFPTCWSPCSETTRIIRPCHQHIRSHRCLPVVSHPSAGRAGFARVRPPRQRPSRPRCSSGAAPPWRKPIRARRLDLPIRHRPS